MIICFEEKDRAAIESKGITIIEFKRDLYKFESNIRNAWENLKECADKVIKGFNIMAERFLEMVESVKLVFEEICEIYGYPTSYRYRIAKVFSKCTGTDIRFCWKFTWKIKRWIARSLC